MSSSPQIHDLSPEQLQDILKYIKKMPRKDAVKFIKAFVDSHADIRADIITGQPIEPPELKYLQALFHKAFPDINNKPQHIIEPKLMG
jgi:F0F1-type ATP synthase delta subunit